MEQQQQQNTQTQNQQQQTSSRTEGEGDGKGGDKEVVPYSEFKHVKDDLHKHKEEARIAKDELAKIREQEMKNKEQWKEYGQAKEKDANEWKQKYETLNGSIMERSKYSAVRAECAKLGLIDAAADDLETLELKDVVVETTSTGRVNVIGAKSAAERIKALKPHWFSETRAPNVNSRQPNVNNQSAGGAVTYEDLQKLEEVAKKTGDFREYKEKLMVYKKQQK